MITKEQIGKLYQAILPKNQIIGDIPIRDILIGDVLAKHDDTIDLYSAAARPSYDQQKILALWWKHGYEKPLQWIEEYEIEDGLNVQDYTGKTNIVPEKAMYGDILSRHCEPLFQFLIDIFVNDEE